MKRIKIIDTTLRDGEQAAGISFSSIDKVNIAKMLDHAKIDELEIGFAAINSDEKRAIRKIVDLDLKAKVIGWNRLNINDIKESISAGLKRVHLSVPVSSILIKYKFNKSYKRLFSLIKDSINFALDKSLYVSIGGEDSSRANINFLLDLIGIISEYKIERFRYCDTVGISDPFTVYNNIKKIKKCYNISIEMHMHNDLGLAVANSYAGIKAGAEFVDTTINGIGERAGNCSLEEIIFVLIKNKIKTKINTEKLKELSSLIESITKIKLVPWKPIVGKNVFLHESGLHQNCIVRDPSCYEPFKPELLKTKRKLVIGKHSGREALKKILLENEFELDNEKVEKLFNILKENIF